MSTTFEVNVELREDLGKGASRRLRRLEGKVPGIVYGAGKAPQPISLSHAELIKHVEDEAFFSHILTLVADGKSQKVIVKDLQRHPYKPKITHADFMRVKAGEKLTVNVPLHFTNEETSPGVKAGGIVLHHFTTLEVSCLPKDLPEFIEVDMAKVALDQLVHMSDIVLPKGVEIVALTHVTEGDQEHAADFDQAIAVIELPRAAADSSADADEEAGEDSAE